MSQLFVKVLVAKDVSDGEHTIKAGSFGTWYPDSDNIVFSNTDIAGAPSVGTSTYDRCGLVELNPGHIQSVDAQSESERLALKPGIEGRRHPSTIAVLKHFRHSHLKTPLTLVSALFTELAYKLADTVPEGPDLTCALRDLLSAKDNAVRAKLG